MLLNDRIRKPSMTELEDAYQQLSDMYQELYAEKQTEIDLKDIKIEKLSKQTRQWMRRYHQLEVSTREDSVDVSDIDNKDHDYIQQLQNIVAEMSKKNAKLEKRIAKHKAALQSTSKPAMTNEKCEVIELSHSRSKDVAIKNTVKSKATVKAPQESKEVELKFSPKFQALLERHAHECNS